MPTTPILGITEVTTSQSGKETTINDAINALEAASNATLTVSMAAGNVTLTAGQATRNYIFVPSAGVGAAELRFPITVNSNDFNRVFVVRNDSGYAITVKFASGAGSTVVVPDGESRLISGADGLNMTVAAEPPSTIAFIALTDVPGSYTGEGGKVLAVNIAENAIEFIDAAVFPSFIGEAGKVLAVTITEDGVEWIDPTSATDFIDLDDAPSSYTGQAGKIVAVTGGEDGVEFIDLPPAEVVEYIAAERWRIFVIDPGSEPEMGFAEVEFRDLDGIDLTGSGTESASNYATGFEPEFAFDDDVSGGNGWLTETSYVGDVWLEYDFGTPVTVRSFRLTPFLGIPEYTPTRFKIQYYDGAVWVDLGDRTADTWVSAVAQTFNVNGVPLTSILEAPIDGTYYARKDGDWEPLPSSSYTDENARDAIATMIADSATIDFTNNDGGDSATFDVIQTALKPTETIIVAASDETTAITTGAAKITFRMPYAFTITAVRASVTTAPTGAPLVIDINEDTGGGATTILSTKLSIDATEKTSTTATTAAVISDTSLADDSEMTIDFDQVGSSVAGAGVKVYIIGHRT